MTKSKDTPARARSNTTKASAAASNARRGMKAAPNEARPNGAATARGSAAPGEARQPDGTTQASTWGAPRFRLLRDPEQARSELAAVRAAEELRERREAEAREQEQRDDDDDRAYLEARVDERQRDPRSLTRERAATLARALDRIAASTSTPTATSVLALSAREIAMCKDASLVQDIWERYRGRRPGWLEIVDILDSLVLGHHDGLRPARRPTPAGVKLERLVVSLASAWIHNCGKNARAPLDVWRAVAVAWNEGSGQQRNAALKAICDALDVAIPPTFGAALRNQRAKSKA